MNGFSLLFPDFAMIAAGFLMVRTGWLGRDFWEGAEKLVYFVLLPALLIAAITRSDLSSGETGIVVQITLLSMVIAAGLGRSEEHKYLAV